MAIPSGKFPSPDAKYPFVGSNYQKYGEADGYIYDPWTDKYYINPESYKATGEKTGAIKKSPNTGLMATLVPTVGLAAATEIAKAMGMKAVPALSDISLSGIGNIFGGGGGSSAIDALLGTQTMAGQQVGGMLAGEGLGATGGSAVGGAGGGGVTSGGFSSMLPSFGPAAATAAVVAAPFIAKTLANKYLADKEDRKYTPEEALASYKAPNSWLNYQLGGGLDDSKVTEVLNKAASYGLLGAKGKTTKEGLLQNPEDISKAWMINTPLTEKAQQQIQRGGRGGLVQSEYQKLADVDPASYGVNQDEKAKMMQELKDMLGGGLLAGELPASAIGSR